MPCNPLFYSFLVLLPQEAFLFIEESRLNWPVSSWKLSLIQVIAYTTTYASIRHRLPYSSFPNFLQSHATAFNRWWVDPRSSINVLHALGRDRVFLHRSVVQEMKEVKNQVEISGMREAHARDCGAAVIPSLNMGSLQCDLFGWLEHQIFSGEMVKESDVPEKLAEFQKYHLK